jgi:hypothetical protein
MDMTSIRQSFLGALSCALMLTLGCGGDDTQLGTTSMDATETGTTSADTTTTPPPTTGSGTNEGTTDTTGTPQTSATDTGEDDDDTSSDTTGEGAWGSCQQGCREPVDCCPALGGDDCPNEGVNEWACTDEGLCEKIGCTADDQCESLLPAPLGMDLRCRQVDGVGECVLPCADDVNCSSLTGDETCSGVADDNSTYCAQEAEEENDTDGEREGCEAHSDCEGLGLCDVRSGECYCTESIDCTDDTLDTCVVR